MNFPTPDKFVEIMEETGMVNVEKYPLTFGVTWLHIGKKPEADLLRHRTSVKK